MKHKNLTIWLLLTILISPALRADEGMWIPLLIEKYNIKLMQEKGFKLQAEDIYSVNKACMKDAIVIFGGGCTGELISGEGLLITNHHCGYRQIQRHSTLEHDYLTDGFWAMSRAEELPNTGLVVTFLKSMEDVSEEVLEGIDPHMENAERDKLINSRIIEINKRVTSGNEYSATVKPFFMGNQYFLFVYETFRDIRLVGAPPSAIGKFGGDTDNWIWPRHTGDFSLFRIYAGKDNKPASYSKDNSPYKPAYHFPISLKGVDEGDFTMVFGYPGSTSEYATSFHIDMIKNYINPRLIDIRTKKLEIIGEDMNSDPLIRIQYSAKSAGISNSWKRWIGENLGLEKMGTIDKKIEYEKRITSWINSDQFNEMRYGTLLSRYEELYEELKDYSLVNSFTNEVFFSNGIEAIGFARSMSQLYEMISEDVSTDQVEVAKMNLLETGNQFFKNYNIETDKKLFIELMTTYGETLDQQWQTQEYLKIKKSCKGDFSRLVNKIYSLSIFTDYSRFKDFITTADKSALNKLKKDPLYMLAIDANDFLVANVRGQLSRINKEIQDLDKSYMAAQMEFEKDKVFYPDANSTLRVAFGNVKGYMSKDAVYFTHYTTLNGIIEKDNPAIYDYDVPDKLRELYRTKDYGPYTQNGEVPVCFIANNHTTGGNSGSPVINGNGELIGVNFDRAWEGVASDLAYNPEQSRNISLDIRYALFIIDKFAGAGYLLNEMTLIK